MEQQRMRACLTAGNARKALTAVCRAAKEHVTLAAGTEGLVFRTADHETSARLPMPADVASPGGVVVEARMLRTALKGIPAAAQVTFGAEAHALVVETAEGKWVVPAEPAADAAAVGNGLPEKGRIRVSAQDVKAFVADVKAVSPAFAPRDIRPSLRGLIMVPTENGLMLTGCNGHVLLTRITNAVVASLGYDDRFTIPANAVKCLIGLVREGAGISIVLHGSADKPYDCHVALKVDGGAEVSARTEGMVPEIMRLFSDPADARFAATAAKTAWCGTLAKVYRKGLEGDVVVEVGGGGFAVETWGLKEDGPASKAGSAAETIGGKYRIGLNPAYLAMALEAARDGSETTVSGVKDRLAFDSEEGRCRCVVMPKKGHYVTEEHLAQGYGRLEDEPEEAAAA